MLFCCSLYFGRIANDHRHGDHKKEISRAKFVDYAILSSFNGSL